MAILIRRQIIGKSIDRNGFLIQKYKNTFKCPKCGTEMSFYFHTDYHCEVCDAVLPPAGSLIRELDDNYRRYRWATIYFHEGELD